MKCPPFPFFERMFYIVQFSDEDRTVSVVPQSWYSNGGTYWPNYKNDERINKAAKLSEEPRPDWTRYNARVLKTYGNCYDLVL